MSSLAGPSRLPMIAPRRIASLIRQYATTSDTPETPNDASKPAAIDGQSLERMDRDQRRATLRDKKMWGTTKGFKLWERGDGKDLATVGRGEKAKWLGGDVPYPGNPTFKPPAPLANDLQDLLYREMLRGNKPLSAISTEYSVSKARLEGIRKLKEVEAEMRRQNLPLQRAFQEGMEPLLGVMTGVDSRTRQYSERAQRDATLERETHASTIVEREEEQRLDTGIGEGGAFGTREEVIGAPATGIERTAWEYRDEDEVIKLAAAQPKAHVTGDEQAELADEMAHDPFPTPHTVKQASDLGHSDGAAKANVTVVGRFRFIDVSSPEPTAQPYQVYKRSKKRAKNKNRKLR